MLCYYYLIRTIRYTSWNVCMCNHAFSMQCFSFIHIAEGNISQTNSSWRMAGVTCVARFLGVLTLLSIKWNDIQATVVDMMTQGLLQVPDNMSQNLQELYLDYNHIQSINSSSFQTYALIEILSIQNNTLRKIGEHTFWNNSRLKQLLLGTNYLNGLPRVLGPSIPIMTALILTNAFSVETNLSALPISYFRNFTSLIRLIIGSNIFEPFDVSILPSNIKKLNMPKCGLTVFPNLSRFTTKLRNLKMNRNFFLAIPRQNFQLLLKLQVFNLTGNKLSIMPNVSGLSSLRKLDLSGNDLTVIPDNTLNGLNKLKLLVISENHLTYVVDMSHLTGLTNLWMNENSLRSIPDLFVLQLMSLYLGSNPLVCNQSLCWIRMMPLMSRILDVDDILCNYPGEQQSVSLMEVHPTDIDCYKGESANRKGPDVSIWL